MLPAQRPVYVIFVTPSILLEAHNTHTLSVASGRSYVCHTFYKRMPMYVVYLHFVRRIFVYNCVRNTRFISQHYAAQKPRARSTSVTLRSCT